MKAVRAVVAVPLSILMAALTLPAFALLVALRFVTRSLLELRPPNLPPERAMYLGRLYCFMGFHCPSCGGQP